MTITPYSGPAGEFPSHSMFNHGAKVMITDDDGEHFGWQFTVEQAAALNITNPERVAYGGLKTPSVAKQAALTAQTTEGASLRTKDETARNYIIAQVNAIKAGGGPGTWSTADRRFMSLVWVIHRLD